jgi:hypothetical protein
MQTTKRISFHTYRYERILIYVKVSVPFSIIGFSLKINVSQTRKDICGFDFHLFCNWALYLKS